MQLTITEIKIKKRVRKDLGNLSSLMESLRAHGLMNPIVVNAKHELIAGHRRLESARSLGWERVEVTVMDAAGELGMLELEMEENMLRRDFSAGELAEAQKKLAKLRTPGFFRRLWLRIKQVFVLM